MKFAPEVIVRIYDQARSDVSAIFEDYFGLLLDLVMRMVSEQPQQREVKEPKGQQKSTDEQHIITI